MPVMRISIARLVLSALWLFPVLGHADGGEITINVSRDSHGVKDSGDEHWVSSLQAANDLLHCLSGEFSDITVRVAEGLYRKQSVSWTYSRPRTYIFIVASGRVVMEGTHNSTWLRVPISKGEPTNIHVQGFRVSGYKTAISFEGDRERLAGWNGNNYILNNVFYDIGGLGSVVSTAALRLVNSRDNYISGNVFDKITNEEKCAGLHAVYLAHYSSGNTVSGNKFRDGCGDPIRIRDASNGNIITNNIFHHIGWRGLVTEWHCNKGGKYTCTKINGPECLSKDNLIRANNYQGDLPLVKKFINFDLCSRRSGH